MPLRLSESWDTNSMSSTAVTSFFDAPIRPTGASPFQITKNSPKGLFGALIREAGLTMEEFTRLLL